MSDSAQAIAERDARPMIERRGPDQSRFVQSWLHPDHWTAADKAMK